MEGEAQPTTTAAKNDRDLQPGAKVGEYVVEAKIGEGGFGAVFRAAHPLIGKLAAIKVLNRQYSADPEMVSRFVAEARAVNQIRHRNIIDIFAFGQIEDGRSYYVMELLDGHPLDEYLAKGGAMPLGEAIPVLRAVARALDAAHAKGIAHRDLKPENIFLVQESDGTIFPKLLDFGIAKLMGTASGAAMHKTRTGAPIGTPYYMSPEQCRGRDVDHRTDIYAFGVVAYKLLTGVVPFDGEDYMDILLKQIGEEPVPPSQRMAGLPHAVDDAIAWMMKKDPAARPPNLITAMRALEEAAQSAGIEFMMDGSSGLHASQTARVLAQRTPSAITPVPRGTPGTGAGTQSGSGSGSGIGSLQTIAAGTPGTGLATGTAERAVGVAPTMAGQGAGVAAAGAGVGMDGRRSPVLLVAALVGAVVIGAVVFVMVRSGKGGGEEGERERAAAVMGQAGAGAGTGAGTGATTGTGTTTGTGAGTGTGTIGVGAGTGAGSGTGTGTGTGTGGGPRLVTVEIQGPPEGTEVYGPRGLLGVAPGAIQLDRADGDVVLTFKADGYKAASHTVEWASVGDDPTVEITLEKVARTGGTKSGGKKSGGKKGDGKSGDGKTSDGEDKKGRDTLEDPFGSKK